LFKSLAEPEEDSENVGKDENCTDISTEATDGFGLSDHIVLKEVSNCGTKHHEDGESDIANSIGHEILRKDFLINYT